MDNLSIRVLIALFAVGLVLVLVDVVLFAGIVLQGGEFSWPWAVASRPTRVAVPAVQVWPAEGRPGALITVTGQGWQANAPLVVQLEAPSGICPVEVVATPNARPDGTFGDSFLLSPEGCWRDLPSVLVVARSLQTDDVASTRFVVVPAEQTSQPTATLPGPVVIEPTATATLEPAATPTTEPTATPTTEPAATPTTEPTATPTPEPTATPTPVREPAITDWRAEYYANVNLAGSPVLVRNDRDPNGALGIAFDWAQGVPASGLPADGFSVRWTRTASFEEGLYRFRAVVDDGLRLYVDGDLLINEWRDGSRREVTADRRMTAGKHTLRVEYFERSGFAVTQVRWEKVSSYPEWKGEYWPNLALQGNPVVVRNDKDVAFDWGEGSPAGGIPSDGFSARWTRTVALEGGTYAFHVLLDDGVRVWLNDRKILDAWADHDAADLRTDLVLAKGTYTIRIEYYERIGKARVHLWWERNALTSYRDWKGEYWPNRDLSGDIVLVRNDRDPDGTLGLDFSWGPNAPFLGMPTDNFSARWTRKLAFEAGSYRFHVIADDGVRLWVDGKLLIDAWRDQEPHEITADRELSQGNHDLKVEFYEHVGGARIQVWWEKWSTPYPDWKTEFWANRDLSGTPAVTRNDRGNGAGGLDYDWGTGAPAKKVPADDFSARWTRELTLQPGRYRLLAVADDGIRVYLDDHLAIDEWHKNKAEQTYSADVNLTGTHRIRVEYFEQLGNARLKVWWKRIGDLPRP